MKIFADDSWQFGKVILTVGAVLLHLTVTALMAGNLLAASAAAPSRDVNVYAAADDGAAPVETIRDGSALTPMGEMTGAGGDKWFMVKTKAGNIGWIKAGDQAEVRRIDDHFRAMPRELFPVGRSLESGATGATAAGATPASSTKDAATGAITIPVKINGPRVVVPVTLIIGNSSATGNLLVDTGASQTMISTRLAKELQLRAIDNQTRTGIGGSIRADVGQVDAIKVGDAEAKTMRVTISDRAYDLGSEGLLGFDFLGRFQMTVDTDKQVMVLTPRKK